MTFQWLRKYFMEYLCFTENFNFYLYFLSGLVLLFYFIFSSSNLCYYAEQVGSVGAAVNQNVCLHHISCNIQLHQICHKNFYRWKVRKQLPIEIWCSLKFRIKNLGFLRCWIERDFI